MTLRLAAMMFLQFFTFGAWYVTVGNYMAANGMERVIHWAYTVNSLAALVSPFLLGLLVDRYFATERVLGVLGLLGGAAMLGAALVPPGASGWFIGLLLVHALCFVPTLSLGSTLAFHHLTDQTRQFPVIRAFGSIGWIAAGVLVSGILKADPTPIPLFCAAGAALAFGVYGFTLPHTPPRTATERADRAASSTCGCSATSPAGRLWCLPCAWCWCSYRTRPTTRTRRSS